MAALTSVIHSIHGIISRCGSESAGIVRDGLLVLEVPQSSSEAPALGLGHSPCGGLCEREPEPHVGLPCLDCGSPGLQFVVAPPRELCCVLARASVGMGSVGMAGSMPCLIW